MQDFHRLAEIYLLEKAGDYVDIVSKIMIYR